MENFQMFLSNELELVGELQEFSCTLYSPLPTVHFSLLNYLGVQEPVVFFFKLLPNSPLTSLIYSFFFVFPLYFLRARTFSYLTTMYYC